MERTKPISYSERFIADHQIDVQEALIECELMRLDMQMSMSSTGEVWAFKEGLNLIRRSLKAAREDLHQLSVGRKWPWQRLRIAIYKWSVQERFK